MRCCAFLMLLMFGGFVSAADPAKLPLVFEEDFEKEADRWEPTDVKAWKILKTDKGNVYSQFVKNSNFKPPHRSPFNIALVKDLKVGDFALDARCKSTIKDYDHRDMCLFFGYQDNAHFYYVHFGKKTDDHANQIFIVNGADRKKISTKTTEGTKWTDDWHKLRIERNTEDGTIKVYFDDMKTPVMEATDKTFTWGRVGVGSFDDTGDWDDIKIWGSKSKATESK